VSGVTQQWLCTIPLDYFPDTVRDQFDAIAGRLAWTGPSPIPHGDLHRMLGNVDGVLVWPPDRLDAEFLASAPQLRVISTVGTGVDHIDLAVATSRGILVCHTPGLNVETVADHTLAVMLAVVRRLAEQGRLQRDGQFLEVHRRPVFGRSLTGSTLGLIGLGAIGAAVARRARSFAMPVLYASRSRKRDLEAELGLEWATLDDLLRQADIVSLHAALTPETYGLIGERELAMMQPRAVLVNTARGPLVDTDALVTALRSGHLLGAGLDVTDPEPLPIDHPLFSLPNVVLTPHTGYASDQTRAAMTGAAIANLADALAGRRPRFLANPAVWTSEAGTDDHSASGVD
jgi:glyoxylate reductase